MPFRRHGGALHEHLDDDTTILSAAGFGLVRRDGLVLTVADDVHLVQRDLVLLVQVALHRLSALEADLLVDGLVADVVDVSFDLDVHVIRIPLYL